MEGMPKCALKHGVNFLKSGSALKLAATTCMDGHQSSPEHFTRKRELAPVSVQVVLKSLCLARIGTVKLLAESVKKLNKVRTDNTVLFETRLRIAH